jgi:predicted ATPase
MLLAEAFSMAGSNETALTVIDQAIAIAEQTGERWCVAEILRIKAGLLLATDPASEQVEILLASSLHVARSQNARCWELRAACDLAALWQRKNRTKDALLLLQPVYAQFTEGFDSADLQKARRILDGLETPPSEKQEKSNKRKARG